MPQVWIQFLFWSEAVFNIIFTLETVIRLVAAWSIKDYICENFPTNIIGQYSGIYARIVQERAKRFLRLSGMTTSLSH